MSGLAPLFGVLAAVVGVVDTIPYVRDILRGSTRPHRGTWLIWGVLAIVVCLSQRADGALVEPRHGGRPGRAHERSSSSLAIRMGEGGLSRADAILIAIAGGGVAGWILVDEPLVATVCVVAADLIAAAMMVPKVYRDPGSETLVTFALASVGGALAVGAVGHGRRARCSSTRSTTAWSTRRSRCSSTTAVPCSPVRPRSRAA